MKRKAGLSLRKIFAFAGSVIGIFSLTMGPGFAHERHYAFNEEYHTLPKGGFEIENWVTFKMPKRHTTNENTFEYQEELEYGVVEHWTLAHYERWETVNHAGVQKDATKYSGFKFESKYRIGERGKYWVDPLLYLEIARDPRDHDIPLELEGKLVLSKNFGKWNVSYNQIIDSKTGSRGRTEHEFTVGANYEITNGFRLGVESTGQYWKPGSNRNELALGPAIAYSNPYFWLALGSQFGVNHAADDWQARVIVGIPIG